jgi:hypothetical protein
MSEFSFVCSCCGQRHDGLPDLAFRTPYYWSAAVVGSGGNWITSDLCVIDEHYFIRCVLEVPIKGADLRLGWGVWVTQSRSNFDAYSASFDVPVEKATFGYLANQLPTYPDTLNLHTLAHWRLSNQRPLVEPEPSSHPLYRDWSEGIERERAIGLAELVLHPATKS